MKLGGTPGAYLQAEDIGVWHQRVAQWIIDLSAETSDWTTDDTIHLSQRDPLQRMALLSSRHQRSRGLEVMDLDHLWIEM